MLAEELALGLRSPERWTRDVARRLIGERGRIEMESAIRALASSLEPSDPEFERIRLEVLWAFQSLNLVDVEWLDAVLGSPDHRPRAAAMGSASCPCISVHVVEDRLKRQLPAAEHPGHRQAAACGL